MAKLIAPLMSMSAKGNIGGILNYATVRGTSYVRKLKPKKAPFDPKTEVQLFNRYYFKNIIIIWQNLEEQERDFFGIYSAKYHLSGFNYFTRIYIEQHPSELGNFILGGSMLGDLVI